MTVREKAELYDHMLEVAKANGFDCLNAAIVDGVKYRKMLRELGELKGAILEAGIALGMGKPVIVCLPDGVKLDGPTQRPIGSWLWHRNVTRCDDLTEAMAYHPGAAP